MSSSQVLHDPMHSEPPHQKTKWKTLIPVTLSFCHTQPLCRGVYPSAHCWLWRVKCGPPLLNKAGFLPSTLSLSSFWLTDHTSSVKGPCLEHVCTAACRLCSSMSFPLPTSFSYHNAFTHTQFDTWSLLFSHPLTPLPHCSLCCLTPEAAGSPCTDTPLHSITQSTACHNMRVNPAVLCDTARCGAPRVLPAAKQHVSQLSLSRSGNANFGCHSLVASCQYSWSLSERDYLWGVCQMLLSLAYGFQKRLWGRGLTHMWAERWAKWLHQPCFLRNWDQTQFRCVWCVSLRHRASGGMGELASDTVMCAPGLGGEALRLLSLPFGWGLHPPWSFWMERKPKHKPT